MKFINIKNYPVQFWFYLVIFIWIFIQYINFDTFIFHDTWNHNFPQTYEVAKNSSCMQFAYWLLNDTGAPTIIYGVSFSLTQIFKATLIHIWSCMHPSPYVAMLTYKAVVIASYLLFSVGMYVLGKILFRHWLTPLYLLSASLFAGVCLQVQHSDEVVYIIFWLPWCISALVLALKNLSRYPAPYSSMIYLNMAALFFCLSLMDMYPHIPTLAAIYATAIYTLLYGKGLNFITIVKILPRLWLAVVLILITIGGLYCIQRQIFLFQPQHSRTAITVTANQIGQTAFTQPSALFGWLFPLSFAAGFDEIASRYTWKGFIYRLDILLMYIGTIPLFLSISLLFLNENRRATFGWFLFTLVLAATSMQSTGLYLTIIHFPFFNLFRSYIHFWDYVFFSFLVLSAYGFENIIRCTLEERVMILKKTFVASFSIYILGLISLIIFLMQATGYGPGLRSYLWEIALDITIIIASLVSISLGINKKITSIKLGFLLIAFLIITQTIYLSHIYIMFGENSEKTFARYQANIELLTPISANSWAMAGDIKRIECEKASGCNLSQRPAISLKNNTDGSFFRDLNSPVLRKTIPDNIKSALTGITTPILWATTSISIIPSYDALDSILSKSSLSPQDALSLTTYVVTPGHFEQLNESNTYKIDANFSDMIISPNKISFSYKSNLDGYANLSLTANDGWRSTINGFESPIIRSYYNYVTVKIPQGQGRVILEYSNNLDKYFFWSRNILAFLGLICIVYIFSKYTIWKVLWWLRVPIKRLSQPPIFKRR